MKVSNQAGKVLRLLRERPADGEETIEELARDAGLSKTALARAITELEEAGALTIEEEPR